MKLACRHFILPLIILACTMSGADGQSAHSFRQMRIVFSGDAMMHYPQVTGGLRPDGKYDFKPYFRYIEKVWKDADFAVLNFETTISADGKYSGYPLFSSPKEYAEAVKDAGIDVVLLANNHIMDKGAVGVESTLRCFDSLGISTLGVSADTVRRDSIIVLRKGLIRTALLNYTYGLNGNPVPRGIFVNLIDTLQIRSDILRARQKAEYVIVLYHWGDEYHLKAGKEQRDLAAWTRNAGADVVIGSHPHVVQDYDLENRIVYSLGNLVSNQKYANTDVGMSVEVTIDGFWQPELRVFRHWCDKTPEGYPDKFQVLLLEDTSKVSYPDVLKQKLQAGT